MICVRKMTPAYLAFTFRPGRNRKYSTSFTTTAFIIGCSARTSPRKKPALEATFRSGSPSLFTRMVRFLASFSLLPRSSSNAAPSAFSFRNGRLSRDRASTASTKRK